MDSTFAENVTAYKKPIMIVKQPVMVLTARTGMYDSQKCRYLSIENSNERIVVTKKFDGYEEIEPGNLITFTAIYDDDSCYEATIVKKY